MDRLALVSDLHGNSTAWAAVLADIREVGASAIYCLGDLVGKGPDGAGIIGTVAEVCTGFVAYGDLHAAWMINVDASTLVNVGSVGNPLDGRTAAQYVVLEGRRGPDPGDLHVSFRRVSYDVEAAIALARRREMPELEPYTIELRTGVYRAFHAAAGLASG